MRAAFLTCALCIVGLASPAWAGGGKKPANHYYGYQNDHLRGSSRVWHHAGGSYGSHPKREKPKNPDRGAGAAGQD